MMKNILDPIKKSLVSLSLEYAGRMSLQKCFFGNLPSFEIIKIFFNILNGEIFLILLSSSLLFAYRNVTYFCVLIL